MQDKLCYESNIIIKDSTIFLVGSGESVLDHSDYSFLDDQLTMGLNSAVKLLNRPSYVGWSDFTWQNDNVGLFRRLGEAELIHFTVNPLTAKSECMPNKELYHPIRVESMSGFNTNVPNVNGNNTGTRALNFLSHFRPYNIVLIGFDLQGGNWHKKYTATEQKHHDSFLANFEEMAPYIKDLGINVYNTASPKRSRLTCFEFCNIKDWII